MDNEPNQNTNIPSNTSSDPAMTNIQPVNINTQPSNPPSNSENVLSTAQQLSSQSVDANQFNGNDKITALILEWLTYAFWWWTVLGLSILVGITVSYFVANADTYSFTPYGVAAMV